ncbi:MAG: dynamin family protein [Akkermansia muciniphila]|nr:dynamin family protein [Akkermansia muciniphila]
MNINELISKHISIARLCAPEQEAALRKLQMRSQKSLMKVTVLGDFKAGKSTILNRLFLKEPLLPVDFSECTAVPTQLANGPRRLQLWKRNPSTGCETLVQETETFDACTLASLITAGTDSDRAEKAKKYSRVVLTLPGILADNICLVDTPGMNTPNQGILVGTMAEAQDADLLLYVVRGKTLARREVELLASMCGMQLEKIPVFVVVTHDGTQSPAQLDNICQEIRSSLAQVGITASCSPYDIRSSTSAVSIDASPVSVTSGKSDAFGGWFDTTPKTGKKEAASPEATDAGDLGIELSSFFRDHVATGHAAKILRDLRPISEQIRMQAQARLDISHANAEQVETLQKQLRTLRFDLQRKAEIMMDHIRAIQINFKHKLAAEIDNVVRAKKSELSPLISSQQVIDTLKAWNENLPCELGNTVQLLKIDLRRDIHEATRRFGQDLEISIQDMTQGSIEYHAGFLSKIPSWAVIIGDYALTQFLSPLPIFIDIPLRYLLGSLPLVPANLVAAVAKKIATKHLDEAAHKIKTDLAASMDAEMKRMNDDLRSRLTASTCFSSIELELENAEQNRLSPDDERSLSTIIKELDNIF